MQTEKMHKKVLDQKQQVAKAVATFHRLVNSYFDLEQKIRNRKIN